MISERSCDTEDWSNSALITGINYTADRVTQETVLLNCNNIDNKTVYLYFLIICMHSKKCWVVSTQIWVKYGQTQMLG